MAPVPSNPLPDLDEVRTAFTQIGATAMARLPLYRHLTERSAVDDEVVGRLLLAAPDDRHPTLLFASVHDHLLAVSDAEVEPLCGWYPSVSPEARPVGSGADDPWPHFRRLVLDQPEIEQSVSTRGTQTNEVGRCSTTLLALDLVHRDVDRPIGLVEVGASAGLNVRLDAYGYAWTAESGDVTALRADRSVRLTSRWRGPHHPPAPTAGPVIGHRIGIDREPVDVTDPVAVRWLIACQWPEQIERLERCRAALADAADDPPEVCRGDILDEVAGLVMAVPSACHPVVLSTWVLAYLGVAGQRAFLAALDRVAAERDLTLVLQEEPSAAPGLDLPVRPDGRIRTGPTALCRFDWRDGVRSAPVRLADQHPHGTWAEWFA